MGSSNSFNFALEISLYLLLFSLFTYNVTASSEDFILFPPADPCANVSCGEGRCVNSSTSILGFDCECYDGWKEFQIGPFAYPSCIVPNCSLNFECGKGDPPPSAVTPSDVEQSCNLVWCNNGECVSNGTGHYCQCDDGNENLFDNPAFACFPQCAFEADCHKLGLGPHSPPPSNAAPPNMGSKVEPNCSRKLQALTVIVLSAIFFAWI